MRPIADAAAGSRFAAERAIRMFKPHTLSSVFSFQTWAVTAALLMLAFPSFAQDAQRKVAIGIESEAEFDVIYHRALTDATGVVLGGLIGAGIQSGIESDADAEKRAAIHPHVAEQAWRDVFIRTVTETLAEKDLEPVWIDAGTTPKEGTADMYLVVYPAKFGFRMVDTTSRMVAAFVEFDAAYSSKPIPARNKSGKEAFYLTDKSRVSYDQLIADTAGINPRVESVLKMAARRLTNKMVYNIE